MSDWTSFYILIGSAGAALIGMQFVVVTLIAAQRKTPSADALNAFATPTVVHLTGSLLISAIMSAPWRSFYVVAAVLVICGVGGFLYGMAVITRVRRQTDYEPLVEDWLWYVVLPSSAYISLTVGAAILRTYNHAALFVIALAALALLLIGIRNAWDTVTHIVAPMVDNGETVRR